MADASYVAGFVLTALSAGLLAMTIGTVFNLRKYARQRMALISARSVLLVAGTSTAGLVAGILLIVASRF